jgi:hypothetical protein
VELREWWEDVLVESVKVQHSLEHMEDLMQAFYLQQGIYVPVRDKETRGAPEFGAGGLDGSGAQKHFLYIYF